MSGGEPISCVLCKGYIVYSISRSGYLVLMVVCTVYIPLLVISLTVSSDISIQIICYIQSLFICARTHIHTRDQDK